jgi:hypothetical protein
MYKGMFVQQVVKFVLSAYSIICLRLQEKSFIHNLLMSTCSSNGNYSGLFVIHHNIAEGSGQSEQLI